jgi:hypothetical protein
MILSLGPTLYLSRVNIHNLRRRHVQFLYDLPRDFLLEHLAIYLSEKVLAVASRTSFLFIWSYYSGIALTDFD